MTIEIKQEHVEELNVYPFAPKLVVIRQGDISPRSPRLFIEAQALPELISALQSHLPGEVENPEQLQLFDPDNY